MNTCYRFKSFLEPDMREIHHDICKKFRFRSLILVYIMLYNHSIGRYSRFKSLGHT